MLKLCVRCHVHSLFISSRHANGSKPPAAAPRRAAPCRGAAVRHWSPSTAQLQHGMERPRRIMALSSPTFITARPSLCILVRSSRFIAPLAECKISGREGIGKTPSLPQGPVLSLPPVSGTEGCPRSPCKRAVCQRMLPL